MNVTGIAFALLLSFGAALLSAQAPASGATTLRAEAKLVVLDVVVTDGAGQPVHGLKASDFSLLEDRKPQKIGSFEEHTGLTAAQTTQFDPIPKLPPGIFSNFTPAPVNSALNVLLLDALNTPLVDQTYVRQQLLDYLKHAVPGTSVAIFGLSTQLRMLQGFTTDPEVLKAVVLKQKGFASPLLDDPASGLPTESLSSQMSDTGFNISAQAMANLQTFENINQSFQLQLRAQYTLDGMNQLARFLSGLPGRKNLIWFSGSFPLDILPDTSGNASDPFAGVADSEAEYRETTNLLARSQVAVYPVDGRGLQTSPVFSAANGSNKQYARNPNAFLQDSTKFLQSQADEHSTMLRMAEDTGGEAFINTNGLTAAVSKAIDHGANYYTLSYSPEDVKWHGQYRTIQVQVARTGYTLAYRHGYYADDPNSAYSALTPASVPGPVKLSATGRPDDPMLRAMAHGTPAPTQIVFKVRVLPETGQDEPALAEGNSSGVSKIKGPYRRYRIDFAADPRGMTFTRTPEGQYRASVSFVTLVYTPEGAFVNSAASEIVATLTPQQYAGVLRGGIPFQQQISVPLKGDYSLRVGIRDLTSDHIGAVELAVAAVKNLQSVSAQVAPPPAQPAK